MPRFKFIEDEVTSDEMPKETPSPEIKEVPTPQPKSKKFRFVEEPKKGLIQKGAEVLKEVPGQLARGTTIGLGGTYGDILDLFGLQSKEQLPGEKAQLKMEAEASPEQLALINEPDDILPRYSRLPSSSEVGKMLPSAPKTRAGRYAERAGKLFGGGAALGQIAPGLATAAGALGQSAEELGAPPWVQAAVELGTYLKGTKPGVSITSKSPEIRKQVDRLKKLGYSDEDITLARNALENRGWLKKTSKLTQAAEDKFKQSIKNAESRVDEVLESAIPGMKEGGTSAVRSQAEGLFDSLDDLAKNVIVEKPEAFLKNSEKAIERLKNTLSNTPQEKEVIGVLEKAMESAVPGRTADAYTRFYRGLNQIGKWGSPKEREHIFSLVKDSIKQTLREQGPEGKRVADTLEEANKAWMKYLRAEDVADIISKATTEEGLNFGKLAKMTDNANNFNSLVHGLGKEQASNLRLIAKTADSIKGLKKSIEGGHLKQALGAGKAYALAKALFTGDVSALKTFAGAEAFGRMATKFLTEPKYQNLTLKMLRAIEKNNPNALRIVAQKIDATNANR